MTDDETAGAFARQAENPAVRRTRARVVVCDVCRLVRARVLPAWCEAEGGWSLIERSAVHVAGGHAVYPDAPTYLAANSQLRKATT
ncbi:hypothetical protein [Amycolatopsis sp. cg13]|uniref:hypothetical protein n=1 Tax=Amycolatopsis sp. cg13 TaxID=3238807 RepID=UPI0035265BC4